MLNDTSYSPAFLIWHCQVRGDASVFVARNTPRSERALANAANQVVCRHAFFGED
jgi:hypothetical protein